MQKKNKQNIIKNNYADTSEFITSVKTYISEHDCPTLSIDISNLSFWEASRLSAIFSTYHWSKYPNGQIDLITTSPEMKELVSPFHMGNISIVTAQ